MAKRTQEEAERLVQITFSWCGHTAHVPQTTEPTQCPQGCNPRGGWDPVIARRHSMLSRHSIIA